MEQRSSPKDDNGDGDIYRVEQTGINRVFAACLDPLDLGVMFSQFCQVLQNNLWKGQNCAITFRYSAPLQSLAFSLSRCLTQPCTEEINGSLEGRQTLEK